MAPLFPEVFNHNIETVPRLYQTVRPGADYQRSLAVLRQAALAGNIIVKSGIKLGLGETEQEVLAVFSDLLAAGVTALTGGQYMRPSQEHLPVVEYIHPDKFCWYEQQARQVGFRRIASGSLSPGLRFLRGLYGVPLSRPSSFFVYSKP